MPALWVGTRLGRPGRQALNSELSGSQRTSLEEAIADFEAKTNIELHVIIGLSTSGRIDAEVDTLFRRMSARSNAVMAVVGSGCRFVRVLATDDIRGRLFHANQVRAEHEDPGSIAMRLVAAIEQDLVMPVDVRESVIEGYLA